MPAPAEGALFEPYEFTLTPRTGVNTDSAQRDFDAWHSGKRVRSTSLAIASIRPPAEDLAILYESIDEDFMQVAVPGLPFGVETEDEQRKAVDTWNDLGADARLVLGGIAAAFTEVVHADIARSPGTRMPLGPGQVRLSRKVTTDVSWHVDDTLASSKESIFEAGMRRYVVAFGAVDNAGRPPTTSFLHGPTSRDIAPRASDRPDSSVAVGFREVSYPIGTVACFSSDFGIHRAPPSHGPRVFLTLSSVIVADRIRKSH